MLSYRILVSAVLLSAGAASAAEQASVSGHVDLVSSYVLRGISTTYGPGAAGGNANADAPESRRPALQWGLDWQHASGVYLGYLGGNINYSYKRLGQLYANRATKGFQQEKSIENDFYGGYNGKLGEFGYTVGLIGYAYLNGGHSNAFETKLGVSYGPLSLNAQTLTRDTVWGNTGDTYWTLNYGAALPANMQFSASLGYYTYTREGKFLGSVDTLTGKPCAAGQSFAVGGCSAGGAPIGSGFRHLVVGVSQPIAGTSMAWSVKGLIGGDNRWGVKQGNKVLGSVSYLF